MFRQKDGRVKILKYVVAIIILAGFTLIIGCGDADLLDESTTRYSATATPQWNETDTQEVDVAFFMCSPTESEPILPLDVKIEVTADSTAQPFTIFGYEVHFRNNHGNYFEEGVGWEDLDSSELPTLTGELNNMNYSTDSPVIDANESYVEEGMLVWSHGDIIYYMETFLAGQTFLNETLTDVSSGYPGLEERYSSDFVYDMQVVLNCRTSADDKEFDIETPWTPIHFLDVANCGN